MFFVIPVLNMAYLLKGKSQDITDFFPDIPTNLMSAEEEIDFVKTIRKKKLPDGRTFDKCFSLNKSRYKQIYSENMIAKMINMGLDNATVDEVAETINFIVSETKKMSKYDFEIWLLYITKDHDKFKDVRPLVEKLEDVIDNVLVYTDNIFYSAKEIEVREKFGFRANTKIGDFVKESIGDNQAMCYSDVVVPYYSYYGAELVDILDNGYISDVSLFPYFRGRENFRRRDRATVIK